MQGTHTLNPTQFASINRYKMYFSALLISGLGYICNDQAHHELGGASSMPALWTHWTPKEDNGNQHGA